VRHTDGSTRGCHRTPVSPAAPLAVKTPPWYRRGMRHLIGIAGAAYSGKSTMSRALEERGYREASFAKRLKLAAQVLWDLDHDQLYGDRKEEVDPRWGVSGREIAQLLGTEHARGICADVHATHMEKDLRTVYKGYDVVISDLRFRNEFDLIQRMGGKCVWLGPLSAPKTVLSGVAGHQSESDLTAYLHGGRFDLVIDDPERTVKGGAAKLLGFVDRLPQVRADDPAIPQ